MARPLRENPPTSSITRLLDAAAATRALGIPASTLPVQALHQPEASCPSTTAPFAGPLRRKTTRELHLCPESDAALEALIQTLRGATGTRLSASHVARALLRAAAHCLVDIQTAAAELQPQPLPSNAAGYEHERERFEEQLKATMLAGLRGADNAYRGRGQRLMPHAGAAVP